MGKYISATAVQKRLEGKIEFGAAGSTNQNTLNPDLLGSLINEGETQLEIDLMHRYDIPLVGVTTPFAQLPPSSKVILMLLAELICVIRVLETDFGRGTSANAEKYTEMLQKRYDKLVAQLVEKRKADGQETNAWKLPPLQGVKLAYNNQADSGFFGRVMNTTTISHEADYAVKQINSPGENIFNGWVDPLDRGGHPNG